MSRVRLGLSSIGHRSSARDYAVYFTNSLRMVRRDLAHGTKGGCVTALLHLADANRAAGAAHAHHASRGTGRALRTARQSHAMAKALGKLRQEYIDRCVRK